MTIVSANDTPQQVADALRAHGYEPDPALQDQTQPSAAPADEIAPPPSADGTTAPASEPDAMEQEPPPGTPQAKAAKTRKAVQERIDELTRQRYTEAGRREQAEAEVLRLRQQLADIATGKPVTLEPAATPAGDAVTEPAAPTEPEPPGRIPRQGDFDDYDQYQQALDAWENKNQQYQKDLAAYTRQMAVHDFQQQQAEASAREEAETRENEWKQALTSASQQIPDYEDTLNSIDPEQPGGQISASMMAAVRESELGPQILYYLAKHPDEAQQIFEATYVDLQDSRTAGLHIPAANRAAARAVARLEGLVKPAAPAAATTAPAATNGRAVAPTPRVSPPTPAPIRPLRSGATTPVPDTNKVIGENGYTAADYRRDFMANRGRR